MFQLSPEAFAELQSITLNEYGDISDAEIEEMGSNLLGLFHLLTTPVLGDKASEPQIMVSAEEFKILKFLHHSIHHDKKSPSVREVAAALGFTSSRSGHRMIEKLMKRGLIYRDGEGELQMMEGVRDCEPKGLRIADHAANDNSSPLPSFS